MTGVEQLLQQLVAIPSVSRDEAAIADFVQAQAASWGFEVQRSGNNLWFEVGQGGGPRLLLNSHLDTVPPCAGWGGDPFTPEWRGDHLVGLGANDAKGCVAAILHATRDLHDVPGTVVVALTAEEEVGGQGLATILDRLGPLDAAVVGEPTSLLPCAAQRGLLVLKCVAHGESAHVAHARLGENAIHKAARDIARLSARAFPPHELLGATKAQATVIEGGLARNQVPDHCAFYVDLRTTPNLDHASLVAELRGELESEVLVHSDRYLPKATDPASPIARAALRATGATGLLGSHTASDWAFLGDLPAVKLGPGDTHRSHRPDEFLGRKELRDGVRVYADLARAFFDETSNG